MQQNGSTKRPSYDERLEAEARARGMDPYYYKMLKMALGMSAYCGIAAKLLANPDVVRFDNPPEGQPGHFKWSLDEGSDPPPVVLDVTKPAEEQPGIGGLPGTFRQDLYVGHCTGITESEINQGLEYNFNNEVLEGYGVAGLADPLPAGAIIGPALPFDDNFNSIGTAIVFSYGGYSDSEIPEGTPTYLGVRWYRDSHTNIYYGWVKVQRTGNFLDALAWGYETTPLMPILAGMVAPCPETGCDRLDIENGDCRVDLADLAALLAHYGTTGLNVLGDVNWDGKVDLTDLALMLAAYGNVCQ